MDTTHES